MGHERTPFKRIGDYFEDFNDDFEESELLNVQLKDKFHIQFSLKKIVGWDGSL